jgi:Tfp pilus assembly protein PilN
MGLAVNFREREYRGEKRAILLLYLASLLLLATALYLFSDYLHRSSVSSEQAIAVASLTETRRALTEERETLQPAEAEQDPAGVDYETMLGRYVGRAPDLLLYDLEKTVPEGAYLTGISYDRVSGIAQVNAVANRAELVTKVLNGLEQVADYRQVMLTSQAELEERGGSKFVLKIVDDQRGAESAE